MVATALAAARYLVRVMAFACPPPAAPPTLTTQPSANPAPSPRRATTRVVRARSALAKTPCLRRVFLATRAVAPAQVVVAQAASPARVVAAQVALLAQVVAAQAVLRAQAVP